MTSSITDPGKTCVRSTAAGDDAVTIELMVRSDVAPRFRQLANDDRYPEYATPGDLMRDAAVHRLQDLLQDIADPVLGAQVEGLLNGLAADE